MALLGGSSSVSAEHCSELAAVSTGESVTRLTLLAGGFCSPTNGPVCPSNLMSGFLRANYLRGRVCTSAKRAPSQKLRLLQPNHGNDVPSLLPYAIGHTDQH